MLKKFLFVLTLALVLSSLVGCAAELSSVEEKVDQLKDQAEVYVESKGSEAGPYVESAADDLKDQTESTVKDMVQEVIPTEQDFEMSGELAETIALNYVGFTREEVTGLRREYEIDDGIPQYDVEFYKEGWEYEFEIHGQTGKILSFDKDQQWRP